MRRPATDGDRAAHVLRERGDDSVRYGHDGEQRGMMSSKGSGCSRGRATDAQRRGRHPLCGLARPPRRWERAAMMLRTRLAMGIGGIVALMLVPVGLSLLSLRELRKDTERIRDQEFQAAECMSARSGRPCRSSTRPRTPLDPTRGSDADRVRPEAHRGPHPRRLARPGRRDRGDEPGAQRCAPSPMSRITHTNWLLRTHRHGRLGDRQGNRPTHRWRRAHRRPLRAGQPGSDT